MIYTFYSYKGGVGRSMALANIAELFYRAGLKVLMVDWDLEAPGLERFFPFNIDEILDKPGVVDLIKGYKKQMSECLSLSTLEDIPFEKPKNLAVDVYPNSKNKGKLYLLTAGKRSKEHFEEYASTVLNFDWIEFYSKWEGEIYFEWLRQEFESMADIVLIDSRTGLTEMGGVCTYQFADVIMMFCAPNQQNLEGIYQMARNFKRTKVIELRSGRPLDVVIIPSRVEDRAELELLNQFHDNFVQKFSEFTTDKLKIDKDYFWKFKIPHIPNYAFSESVIIRDDAKILSKDMANAYESIASVMAKFSPTLQNMLNESSEDVDERISHKLVLDKEKLEKNDEVSLNIPFHKRFAEMKLDAIVPVALILISFVVVLYGIHFSYPGDVNISGKVTDWIGYPIKNADVRALPVGISSRTDSNGYFILSNVPVNKVYKLQIRKDITNEHTEILISDDEKKNKSIVIGEINLRPTSIRLFGDIRDYSGQPTRATLEICVKYANKYFTNISVIEFGKYAADVYSNATDMTVYDVNGKEIYESRLTFTNQDIENKSKDFPIYLPSKTTIDVVGKVYDPIDNKPLNNAIVTIGNMSSITNDSGYYELFSVPRSSQLLYINSTKEQITTKSLLIDRYVDLTKPPYLYLNKTYLWIAIRHR